MAIEIVDFPIKNGDFPYSYVNVYQRVTRISISISDAENRAESRSGALRAYSWSHGYIASGPYRIVMGLPQ